MTSHRALIADKLRHMRRMREYLAYSHRNLLPRGIVGKPVGTLTLDESEILAAFRMRFSEFQGHLGKLLRAIAQEEEVEITGFSDVLAFAEKAEILASADDWKKPRDVRNQINHECEENEQILTQLIAEMANCVVSLFRTGEAMKKSDLYHKWVEWDEQDQIYIGKCPDLITGIHGDDPVQLYTELCGVIEEIIGHFESNGRSLPRPRIRPMQDVA